MSDKINQDIEKYRHIFKDYAIKVFEEINSEETEDFKNDISEAFAAGALLSLSITIEEIEFYTQFMKHDKKAIEISGFIKERILHSNENTKKQ